MPLGLGCIGSYSWGSPLIITEALLFIEKTIGSSLMQLFFIHVDYHTAGSFVLFFNFEFLFSVRVDFLFSFFGRGIFILLIMWKSCMTGFEGRSFNFDLLQIFEKHLLSFLLFGYIVVTNIILSKFSVSLIYINVRFIYPKQLRAVADLNEKF